MTYRGRAWRRSQYERAKKRVHRRQGYLFTFDRDYPVREQYGIFGRLFLLPTNPTEQEWKPQVLVKIEALRSRLLGRYATTRCPCNCASCRNKRYVIGQHNPSTRRRMEAADYQED